MMVGTILTFVNYYYFSHLLLTPCIIHYALHYTPLRLGAWCKVYVFHSVETTIAYKVLDPIGYMLKVMLFGCLRRFDLFGFLYYDLKVKGYVVDSITIRYPYSVLA